jgi:PAS domain S-box-containing protein
VTKHTQRIQKVLHENEERMRAFAAALPDLAFIMDEDGRYIEILTSQNELLYADPAILKDRLLHDVLPKSKADLFLAHIREALKSWDVQTLEYELEVPKGKTSFECRIAPIQTRIRGKRAVACVSRDITRRKETEAKLAKSEKKYRTLFEESKDVVYFSTPEGRFRDINPAGIELLGYDSREEVINIDFVDALYVNRHDRERLLSWIKRQGYVKDFEVELKKKDGTKVTVQITATTELDADGTVRGYRGIMRDISQQKKLQARLLHTQKMEAIGTLAGGIAHDFNNILAAVLGYVELLRLDLPEHNVARANLEEIYIGVLRAKDLVRRILAFSRKDEPEVREVELGSIVREAVRFLGASLPSTITIKDQIDDDSGLVLADPAQMHQVVMNLCTNAFQAMHEKGGELHISLENTTIEENGLSTVPKGPYFKLTVSDNGHGMDSNTLKQAFDPFFTTKPAGEGTGMGLALVHGIVRNHGGDISVYSKVGVGTTFTVYLPRLEKTALKKDDKVTEPAKGNESILLIDDEKAILTVGQILLESLGYRVVAISDPNRALQLFKTDPGRFDLVITDLTMPQLNGIELIMSIKSIREEIPVVLMTGFRDVMSDESAQKLDVGGFLSKPSVTLELSQVVRRALDLKKPR